jgi:hypothetical protein
MRIPPATCKYTQLSRHVRIHDSGRGRGNLIRVFTPSKVCLSPWDRGAHKSSSSVSPCVASDVHAPSRTCMLSYDVVFTCRFAYPTRQVSGKNKSAEVSACTESRRRPYLSLRIPHQACIRREHNCGVSGIHVFCFELIRPCASHVAETYTINSKNEECIKPVLS